MPKGRPRAARLLKVLAGKKNILVTTHLHPDPDALGSASALTYLLEHKLKDAKVSMSIKGRIGGGINEVFVRNANLKLVPWDDATLHEYDAILLLDTQPAFAFSPLPPEVTPIGVIDHHRSRQKLHCTFCDIRVDVGATSSIIFSATSAGAGSSDQAGHGGDAADLCHRVGLGRRLRELRASWTTSRLSGLTLLADPRRLYQMRYVDLPQSYYTTFASGLNNAVYYDHAILSHIEQIDSMEKPAVVADMLLRFEKVDWALVTAVYPKTA